MATSLQYLLAPVLWQQLLHGLSRFLELIHCWCSLVNEGRCWRNSPPEAECCLLTKEQSSLIEVMQGEKNASLCAQPAPSEPSRYLRLLPFPRQSQHCDAAVCCSQGT